MANPMDMMQPGAMAGEAEPQSFEVCISQMPDGQFMVSKEVKEEIESMGDEEMGEHYQSIDEALDAARQMLQDRGEGTPEDQVMKGYNKGMAPARPTVAKVFGE